MFANLDGNEVTLCLENTAGQGSNLGYAFAQLATIMEACSGGKLGGLSRHLPPVCRWIPSRHTRRF